MTTREEMYARYRLQGLRQWVVDVEASTEEASLIYLRGHSPSHGTTHGYLLREKGEVPSRLKAVYGLKGVTKIHDGFFTSVVSCEPARQAELVEEIRARLREMGFLTTEEWEAHRNDPPPTGDPRPGKKRAIL
ncbi:MAG: hypothetical protein U0822_04345 [Anaerolineae bacterium]